MNDLTENQVLEVEKPIKTSSLSCEFTLMEALGMMILWVLIIIFTLGIGAFVLPYYFYKSIIRKTFILNGSGQKIYRLKCDINIAEMIGHIIIWIILTIITFGIALIFYYFTTLRLCLNKTVLVRA